VDELFVRLRGDPMEIHYNEQWVDTNRTCGHGVAIVSGQAVLAMRFGQTELDVERWRGVRFGETLDVEAKVQTPRPLTRRET
jgi:acyl dehydratase